MLLINRPCLARPRFLYSFDEHDGKSVPEVMQQEGRPRRHVQLEAELLDGPAAERAAGGGEERRRRRRRRKGAATQPSSAGATTASAAAAELANGPSEAANAAGVVAGSAPSGWLRRSYAYAAGVVAGSAPSGWLRREGGPPCAPGTRRRARARQWIYACAQADRGGKGGGGGGGDGCCGGGHCTPAPGADAPVPLGAASTGSPGGTGQW